MSSEPTTVQSDLSELIAENFGANATYVETLLARFRSDPSLVDESWRTYFEELLGNGHQGTSTAAATSPVQPEPAQPQVQPAQPSGDGKQTAAATQKAVASPAPATASQPKAEAVPIRGAALKIVENME